MRSPTRRSRKIGLTQGGRVKNGVAREKWSRIFTRTTWERLTFESKGLQIIRENPSRNWVHPASPAQIRKVLDRLPKKLTEDVRAVVLRRTPKKDEKVCVEARKRYLCVMLNAFPRDLIMVWTSRPEPVTVRHMAPWCDRWEEKRNKWVLQWTMAEIRRYYLYHLLLHEVGHIADWHSSRKQREAFAENFALEWARKLGELKA